MSEYKKMKMTLTFLYKNITHPLYSRKGLKLLWCARQTDGRWRQKQTAILTHNFSWPYHAVLYSIPPLNTFSASPPEVLNRRSLALQMLLVNVSTVWLTLTGWTGHSRGICIYHFIKPMISDQLRDGFRLFTQVHPVQRNIWLTARSRVNIQQEYLKP